jgi:hypothetical protein
MPFVDTTEDQLPALETQEWWRLVDGSLVVVLP